MYPQAIELSRIIAGLVFLPAAVPIACGGTGSEENHCLNDFASYRVLVQIEREADKQNNKERHDAKKLELVFLGFPATGSVMRPISLLRGQRFLRELKLIGILFRSELRFPSPDLKLLGLHLQKLFNQMLWRSFFLRFRGQLVRHESLHFVDGVFVDDPYAAETFRSEARRDDVCFRHFGLFIWP